MSKRSFQNKRKTLKTESFAIVLKNIGEINRLKILYLLKKKPKCVCEIWKKLKCPQNLISHHLSVLKKLNLVSSKKRGLKVFYQLNKKVIKKHLKQLSKLI